MSQSLRNSSFDRQRAAHLAATQPSHAERVADLKSLSRMLKDNREPLIETRTMATARRSRRCSPNISWCSNYQRYDQGKALDEAAATSNRLHDLSGRARMLSENGIGFMNIGEIDDAENIYNAIL
jgi:hypothetical protein